jgi:molybdopterin-binding protein
MRLSTRNQLPGMIVEVNLGTVMATVKVRLDGGNQVVTSSITKDAAVDLGLEVGQAATVFIKSTEYRRGVGGGGLLRRPAHLRRPRAARHRAGDCHGLLTQASNLCGRT